MDSIFLLYNLAVCVKKVFPKVLFLNLLSFWILEGKGGFKWRGLNNRTTCLSKAVQVNWIHQRCQGIEKRTKVGSCNHSYSCRDKGRNNCMDSVRLDGEGETIKKSGVKPSQGGACPSKSQNWRRVGKCSARSAYLQISSWGHPFTESGGSGKEGCVKLPSIERCRMDQSRERMGSNGKNNSASSASQTTS